MYRFNTLLLVVCAVGVLAQAQQISTIKGLVTDNSGAAIPGANVTLVVPGGEPRNTTTMETGNYTFAGIAPGKYTVRVSATGFGAFERDVELAPGATVTVDAPLQVTLAKQEVTVEGASTTTVSTDPTQNAGAIVLRGEDLQALSDDPDALAADLQALAGPSAGPNGGQIYVDGFSGARLPPKESIREIRINSNPFSSEYDRLGMGRIEIFTKPGSDKYHGNAMFNFSDDVLNSRNPYAATRAPYQSRFTSVNFGGPLSKKASFFLDFEKRDIDDNAVINATYLDPSTLQTSLISQAVVTPNRRTSFSPRVDFQLNPNNTLVARYHFTKIDDENTGIGDLTLLSRGYNRSSIDHTAQITETAVLGPTMINETRFQLIRRTSDLFGDNTLPAINVIGSFQGGGAQVGQSSTAENRYELTNTTSWAHGAHAVKWGGRLRASNYNDISPRNFGGTFNFAGGSAPVLDANNQVVLDASGQPVTTQITSIERYRRTLLFTQLGVPMSMIRNTYGGGASQFSIAGGNPAASVDQIDGAIFVQDDWRVRPNLTLSLGLRYEMQTNVSDWSNIAPRFGFAWAPGSKGSRPGKTVVRGGFGMFYDRIDDTLTLSTIRFNGLNQQQYIVRDPGFFQNIPALSALQPQAQTIYTKSGSLRAPYMIQSAIGIERQLPHNTTMAVTYTNTRALHLLRSVNLRVFDPALAANDYQYDSSGILNQNQLIFNVNSRLNRRISIFSFYVLNNAKSDTDGSGTFPADPYNWRADYGRAAIDVRHRFVLGGSVGAPWNTRLSPFVIARSGSPFNITTGNDLNNDTIFNDRPALADPTAPFTLTRSAFNPLPAPNQPIIARNFAEGPGYFSVNLRLSKTWGFGRRAGAAPNTGEMGGPGGPGGGGGRSGGGGRGGPGGGGPGGMRMGGGGMRGMFDGGSTEKRFNLTLMASGRNIFNTVNPAAPIGTLTSDRFGQSNQIAGGFGPGSEANNRRMEFGLRFTF